MANRQWRVAGTFPRVEGEVAVLVIAPNWQSALRKGALAIKRSGELKGRRLANGIFTLQVQNEVVEVISGEQTSLPSTVTMTSDPVTEALGQVVERKCSNPHCNQSFAHEGMCDNAPVESQEEPNAVDGSQASQEPTGNTN